MVVIVVPACLAAWLAGWLAVFVSGCAAASL